jgi:hypothetical protein
MTGQDNTEYPSVPITSITYEVHYESRLRRRIQEELDAMDDMDRANALAEIQAETDRVVDEMARGIDQAITDVMMRGRG